MMQTAVPLVAVASGPYLVSRCAFMACETGGYREACAKAFQAAFSVAKASEAEMLESVEYLAISET